MPKSENKEVKIPTFFDPTMVDHFEKKWPDVDTRFNGQVSSAKRKGFQAIKRANKLIAQIETVRKDNLASPKGNTLADIDTYKYGKKKQEELYRVASESEDEIRNVVRKLDNQINSDISAVAERGTFAKETRQHVKSLPEDERRAFVSEMIHNKNWQAVDSVLGGPDFLSGLDAETQSVLKDHYKQERYSNEIAVRDALKDIAENIGRGYQAAQANLEVLEKPGIHDAIARQEKAKKSMSQ